MKREEASDFYFYLDSVHNSKSALIILKLFLGHLDVKSIFNMVCCNCSRLSASLQLGKNDIYGVDAVLLEKFHVDKSLFLNMIS